MAMKNKNLTPDEYHFHDGGFGVWSGRGKAFEI
jgi:hypothetical protein